MFMCVCTYASIYMLNVICILVVAIRLDSCHDALDCHEIKLNFVDVTVAVSAAIAFCCLLQTNTYYLHSYTKAF